MEIKTIIESINKCMLNQHDEQASFFSKVYADSEEKRKESLMELKEVLIFGKFYLENEDEIFYPEEINYNRVKDTVQTYIINVLRHSDRVPAIPGFWIKLGLELLNDQISESSWLLFKKYFSEEASLLIADLYNTYSLLKRLKDFEEVVSYFSDYLDVVKYIKLYSGKYVDYELQLNWILDHLIKSWEIGYSETDKKTIIELINLLVDLTNAGKIEEEILEILLSGWEFQEETCYYAGIIPWIQFFEGKWNPLAFSDLVYILFSGDGHDLWNHTLDENPVVTRFLEQWFFMAEYYPNIVLMKTNDFLQIICALYTNEIVDPEQIASLDRSLTKDGDVEKLLFDVLRLFVKYEDPVWFSKYFFEVTDMERACFFILSRGKSLHYMEDLPLKISKKESYVLANMPEQFIPNRYFDNWLFLGVLNARLIIQGASSELIKQMNRHHSWIAILLTNEERLNVLSGFLIRNTEDFIGSQNKSQTLEYIGYRYNNEEDFSLNGRSYIRLEEEAVPWHRKWHNPEIKPRWNPVSIRNFEKYIDNRLYVIQQINELKILEEEGVQMNHCVGSYATRCISGRSAIFSLKEKSPVRNGRLLTLEVSGRKIVQVKGKNNRNMIPEERSIIEMWAKEEGLGVAV